MISFIVAMDQHRLIGKENDLPWRIPADLQYFKEVTVGHTIVMGRKTHESMGSKPLKGRKNIILTKDQQYHSEGCEVIHALEELQQFSNEEVFIIGGAEIFRQAFALANRLYITEIEHTFEGDTFFPPFEKSNWKEISKVQGIKDEKNPYDYFFVVYERIKE